MTKDQIASAIDVLIDRAPKLRAAGVLELGVDGLHAKLAPAELDGPAETAPTPAPTKPRSIWNDPETFARTETVPGKNQED